MVKSQNLNNVLIRSINFVWGQNHVSANDIVVMMTYRDDLMPIIEAFNKRRFNITVITDPAYFSQLERYEHVTCIPISQSYLIKQVHACSKAKVIFVDTYYELIGAIDKKKGQTVIQTWHEVGALKDFGKDHHKLDKRDRHQMKQYEKVYHATDKYLVGGCKMGICFANAFDATYSHILDFGLPRTVKYYEEDASERQKELKSQLGITNQVAVYLPTERPHKQTNQINLSHFESQLPDYTLIYPDQTEATSALSQYELIQLADLIITDYDSVAIEASIIDKPVLFYVYDEKEYEKEHGLNVFYYHDIPDDYKVTSEEALLARIKKGNIKPLFKEWHRYNTKESLNQLVNYTEKLVKV
ncbi:CDP-glycerol glycerophosphotransferase family protein [Staphylococcus massiliensis]|uniref:Teichoic acid biosynthesis protein B n=1 Tax=Staphylococcus massiliensis S46 TaxID=1229783 RepID=K9AFA3_9STAP|nr:CDP-glycerol glycerophosphotransferase family protein [Staphylococcus massiliensis]EKU46004.1 teichoic acid biosynthesis protein B [Staphylococcus massiliensis S46]MCG3400272.1 CDP-glycerol glycerophosphotransferase family protein [Staphylococcus massiliensis]MCG3401902.1 CDP-glycerol glycerophosphotransferase family protein [Staphylococcus massiliensis]MCG3412436.1 CDP-glycerol glycerophosphotransferase family protein [Staphylococcus massiliensis]PNZ97635.1 teichoic acid biosynthesis prote